MKQIGIRITAARKAKGLAQHELAKMAGTNQGHLSRIESGEKTPNTTTLAALAKALDTTVAQLMGDRASAATAPPKGSPAARILADRKAPQGLKDLAGDMALCETIGVSGEEWKILRSIDLPKQVSKDSYVQLLFTVRAVIARKY